MFGFHLIVNLIMLDTQELFLFFGAVLTKIGHSIVTNQSLLKPIETNQMFIFVLEINK